MLFSWQHRRCAAWTLPRRAGSLCVQSSLEMIPSRVLVPLLSVWWLFVVAADPDDGFYPYGPANDDVALPKDDDVSSPEIRLSVPVTFYGEKYNSLYVSTPL